MLLVGDIHAKSSIIDQIVATIEQFVAAHPEEQTILFLGDYVYHFSYDRKALLQFFRLVVKLVNQGKDIYVLAGNHDRIANNFVFSEGEELLGIIDGVGIKGSLQFVTQPTTVTIEGVECILFPYATLEQQEPIDQVSTELIGSTNGKERQSGYAYVLLEGLIEEAYKKSGGKKVLLFHHWYINGTAFPGQFATFSYRSPALSRELLDDQRLLMISGHLHQPFVFKNYCCVGSLWFTSPLETNQCKYCFQLDLGAFIKNEYSTLRCSAYECWIQPYASIVYSGEPISREDLFVAIDKNRSSAQSYLQDKPNFSIRLHQNEIIENDLSLFITHQGANADDISVFCARELLQSLKSVTIKTKQSMMHELLASLHDASLSLDNSIADWKTLLIRFLDARYGQEESKHYQDLLKNLDILQQ